MTDPTRAAELTAAVERLRRTIKYGGSEYVDDVYDNEDAVARSQRHLDEQLLVKHVLAAVAADDDEPITTELARTLGRVVGSRKFAIEPGGEFYLVLDCSPAEGSPADSCDVLIGELPEDSMIRLIKDATRGQLRQLCRALNIALKPIGQEAPTITIAGERINIVGDLQDSKHIGEIIYRPGVDAYDTSVNESLAVVDVEATLRANGHAWQRQGNDYVVTPTKSRSILRREAAQRGEEPPEFSSGREGE